MWDVFWRSGDRRGHLHAFGVFVVGDATQILCLSHSFLPPSLLASLPLSFLPSLPLHLPLCFTMNAHFPQDVFISALLTYIISHGLASFVSQSAILSQTLSFASSFSLYIFMLGCERGRHIDRNFACAFACACACVRACMHACVLAYVYVCVCARMRVCHVSVSVSVCV